MRTAALTKGHVAMGGTDVWDSLLRGARARHAFVSKTIVVLGACISVHTNAGEPSTGKSTLVRHLAGSAEARATVPRESTGPLGFGYIEMSPECGSDEPLRTGVYTVHSADASVATTLPYAFPPVHTAPDASALASLRRVSDALFVITLDWREPWSFLAQLAAWLALLDALVRDAHAEGCDADAETTRVEMRTKRTCRPSCTHSSRTIRPRLRGAGQRAAAAGPPTLAGRAYKQPGHPARDRVYQGG